MNRAQDWWQEALAEGKVLVDSGFWADLRHRFQQEVAAGRLQPYALRQAGQVPIVEPGLAELVRRHLASQRLRFTTILGDGAADAQVVIVAVGTPPRSSGEADLSQVMAVAEGCREVLGEGCVVVIKSTVPVGTFELFRDVLSGKHFQLVQLVSNPEFLREGHAVQDFFHPDRIVIGADDAAAGDLVEQLHQGITAPIVGTSGLH
ncbi:MAG: UDP-glucose/GDP-mannose dehydrogenase family protein [Deinococcus sp.]|nr:UDP-glucose/GDP-mannose dehydrogenase family protein [Deinococcus sp.]